VRSILGRIGKAKGDGLSRDEFAARHGRESFRSRVVAEAWKHYDDALQAEKALDFDDLILKPVKLLSAHEDIRDAARARWDFVHIDEFQDTNALQGRLAHLIAGGHRNLFVVGDIDQTIYTWRGATIDNLLAFDETYPAARTIVLEMNYRSTKTIVDAANGIIEKNVNRKEKKSVTENAKGDKIRVHAADTAEAEARWIAEEARHAIERGIPPEEIAVLYRTNFQSRALEEGFLSQGIRYRLLGTRYFDRKEVKDVLSWIRLALDPTREADRMRATQSPPRGIGKTTLGKLVAGKRDDLRPAEAAKVEAVEELIGDLSRQADALSPSAFVRLVVAESGLEASLGKSEEDQDRLENIRELATFASRYDGMAGKDGIAAFLADAALAGDQDEMDRSEKNKGVTLMTVHAAKGLEFDTVFVAGMEEGLFPHEGMGQDEERDEEEERRLFYVAMTRAKRKLYLTLSRVRRIYGTDYFQEPSQFIRDIDAALTDVSFGDEDGVPVIRI
jgi:DNA helicase-2/ATP-dependent DNA helicase PcrA